MIHSQVMAHIQSDDRLITELVDAQPQAVIWFKPVWNSDGGQFIVDFEYSYCNQEALQYTGLSKEQISGLCVNSSPILDEQSREQVFDELLKVYLTGKQISVHHFNQVLRKHVRVLRSRIHDGVLTIIQDHTEEYKLIEELKEKTRQLEEQQSFTNSVLDSSLNAIYACKAIRNAEGKIRDLRFLQVNKAYTQIVGLSAEQVVGSTMLTLFPDVKDLGVLELFEQVLKTGEPLTREMKYSIRGTNRWYDYIIVRKCEDEVVVTFGDITSTKEALLKLEKSMEDLKRTNANLEEFTYAASHDLKEPIRKVRTFADRLKAGLQSRLNEKELYLFSRLENATDRMKLLVDDLLAYSYVNLNSDMAEEVDLNNKIQLVLGDLELLVDEKDAKISIAHLPVIRGYRRQLQQLFHNLISNAIKYSKPGVRPEINITCRVIAGRDSGLNMSAEEMNQEYYLIEVSDNGIGFGQKDAERIFNVFQRLHGNSEYKGSGVGLSIARKVAENHKGFLTAKGIPGTGATFQILLPVQGMRPSV
jgi:PAS domain S-box-containing protein